ncbi:MULTISPECIES: regulatory protein RecX [Thermoanaerobacterium]|uniref:Regulatory protein RecX n=2 Tax=Thermoanaerobacterium TaxID=28895 RepID=W9EE98_9THEO|nr:MULTISPECIES: RecX family transcriptional regulator [Thermoanaerobacterium]AFK86851.1 Regulatory protein recX [Thermoanaerobacterium saccharolyticum JW/SL-YS485]ETO39340.1 Regulatory protein recX [Thermoanaerobacterium aotearoense SCUT27]
MKITSVEKQKNDNMRFNVYIDDKYAFSISYEEKEKFKLENGVEIDKEQYNYYVNYLTFKNAYNDAIRILSYNMKTKKELWEKLRLKGYSDSVIGDVINKLIDLHYLDDEYYAEVYVKEKKERLFSKYRIYNELIRKGIEPSLIEFKLSELYDDETEVIQKLIRKKSISTNDKLKIKNYLYRKGFKIEDINKVLSDEEVY